jgi:hypothetical protein
MAAPSATLSFATLKPGQRSGPFLAHGGLAIAALRREFQEHPGREVGGPEGMELPAGHRRTRNAQALSQLFLVQAEALAEGLDPLPVDLTTFAAGVHGVECSIWYVASSNEISICYNL